MLERINEKDIDFCECLYDSLCLAECLFTNYDNLSMFELGKFGHVRMGQIPLLSCEYSIGDNPDLKDKQNFAMKMGAGDCFVMGARNWGKTLFASKVDVLQSLMLNDGYPMGFCSYDAVHIRGVLDPIIDALEYHPIISMYKKTIKRSPSYTIITKNNALLEGINMNIMSANPGHQFFQKHMKKIWIEESSFLTEEVDRKRTESRHEIGCIQRLSGMTNFTKHSPTGKIFYDLTKIPWMFNLPQYVNPKWDKKEEEKAIKKYSGKQSLGYRIFVKGEVVEDGVSVMDMSRIRPFYVEGRTFKVFEISKKIFNNFRDFIVIERPKNADQIFVCADIGGEGGSSTPTEIAILSKVNDKYKFLYNISLFALTDREQDKIFDYIIEKVRPNFISLDTTAGTGRAIYRYLENLYTKESLVWVSFNEKIAVDFDKDDYGNVIMDESGKPTYKEEYVSEWSVKHLRDLLYDGLIEIPADCYKLDVQLNSIKAMQSGTRTIYQPTVENDHLFQAMQTFAIAHWMNEFNLLKPISLKKFAKSGV